MNFIVFYHQVIITVLDGFQLLSLFKCVKLLNTYILVWTGTYRGNSSCFDSSNPYLRYNKGIVCYRHRDFKKFSLIKPKYLGKSWGAIIQFEVYTKDV